MVCKDSKDDVDPDIVVGLLEMLDDCNQSVKFFRIARDRFSRSEMWNDKIRLVW